MTEWYYVDLRHQRQGPVSREALVGLHRSGALTPASLAWREGMNQWTPLGDIAAELGLAVAAPAAAPPIPATRAADTAETPVERPLTGRAVFTASEPSYARHAPAHASQAEAVAATAPGDYTVPAASPYAAPRADVGGDTYATPINDGYVVYAGFWKRVAASVIDGFAIGIPVAIIVAIVGGLFGWGSSFSGDLMRSSQFNPGETVLSWVLSALVFAWFHSSAGLLATPGKLAIGIKVVRTDGEKIGFLRGFGRYWAYLLSTMLLCIGLIMAAFTDRKQGLHDFICDTLVVDKWAFTSQPERQREELGTVALVVLILGGVLLVGLFVLMVVGIAALASMGR